MYVRAGRPAFARSCVGVHKSTSLMSSSLLLQQCPACLVRLTWIVFVIGGRWPYSWCLVGCCRQDFFKIAHAYLILLSVKQGNIKYHFKVFGMTWPGIEQKITKSISPKCSESRIFASRSTRWPLYYFYLDLFVNSFSLDFWESIKKWGRSLSNWVHINRNC